MKIVINGGVVVSIVVLCLIIFNEGENRIARSVCEANSLELSHQGFLSSMKYCKKTNEDGTITQIPYTKFIKEG